MLFDRAASASAEAEPTRADETAAAPYTEALRDVIPGISTRFCVPGHKGIVVPPAMYDAYGPGIGAVYKLDVPLHIEGIDAGPDAEVPFVAACRAAAAAYGAAETFLVTNGASQANVAALLTVKVLAAGERPRIALQRNVHQSTVHGAVLADAAVGWIEPECHPDLDIDLCVTPERLARFLDDHGPFDAVVVVSPTYFGAVADIDALSVVARERGVLLLVDEAWGGHFAMHDCFPTPASRAGAHLVTSSTHKVLGSLTQSAMLHVADEPGLVAAVAKALRLTRTTSPSALLYASLDAARAYAQGEGADLLHRAAINAHWLRRRLGDLPGVEVLGEEVVGQQTGVAAFDPLRVTVDVRELGLTGFEVRDRLLADEAGRIELELATGELVVALFGIGDHDRSGAEHLVSAMTRLVIATDVAAARPAGLPPRPKAPVLADNLAHGYYGASRAVPLETSVGEVCAELITPYPPGIAVVQPGELLTAEAVAYLIAVRPGSAFPDCADPSLNTVQVLTSPKES